MSECAWLQCALLVCVCGVGPYMLKQLSQRTSMKKLLGD